MRTGQNQPVARRLLRLKDAALYLCLSPWKLRRIIQEGQLPIIKIAETESGPWLLDMRDLDQFIERHKVTL
jgi:hypothetical protein